LSGTDSPKDYLNTIRGKREIYNGFNLILGNVSSCLYYSNITNTIEEVKPGIHGLSNHLINTPWPKVVRGKEKLKLTIQDKDFSDKDQLFRILNDSQQAEDEELPYTGIGIELERMMSPIFIQSPNYGTRSSTVLLINRQNHVSFMERSKIADQDKWVENFFEFNIQ